MTHHVVNRFVICLLVLSALFSAHYTLASPYYPTATQSLSLDSGLSGSWFDVSKDGQGFTLQVISPTEVLATWFTYTREGDQAWLQGIGQLTDGKLIFDELNRFIGPTFGDQFDPKDRQTIPAGSLVMSFSSCSRGQATYSGSDAFEADVLELDRLTSLHGFTCGAESTPATESYPPSAVLSGAWYSAAQDGQGWMVEILDTNTALVYWFTYDEAGNQRWMLGVGGLDTGTVSVDKLEVITGPSFGSDYDPDDLVAEIWGDVTLHLWPCDKTSARYLRNARSGRISNVEPLVTIQGSKPCVSQLAQEIETEIWTDKDQLVWRASELEDQTTWCDQSIRWNAPLTNFDVNLDSKADMLLVISCYQGPNPKDGEQHNRQVIAAWRMFCSTPEDEHYDCTRELFGTNEIRATLEDDDYGGSPYTHVMSEPKDLNGDGYPEFWYALNRDDGRPGINPSDPKDQQLLLELCGPIETQSNNEWDCTRKAKQTIIISNVTPDGTVEYSVLGFPWTPRNTQAMAVLPNHLGTYDFFAFNYGNRTIARLTANNKLIDVSDEYLSYRNIDVALNTQPYVHTFEHEGEHYLVTSEINVAILEDPDAKDWPMGFESEKGMTLWRWMPGVGFELSDFYQPAEEDMFTYKQGFSEDDYEILVGAYIKGIPTYDPTWNFFEFIQLHPHEEPVLVAVQEAGTTIGRYYGAAPDPNEIYSIRLAGPKPEGYDYEHVIYPMTPVEAFYIRDGKFVPREQPVTDGNAFWSVTAMRFKDLTGNGYMDMVGHTGGQERGSIYLNDGQGTLEKVNLRVLGKEPPLLSEVHPDFPWAFTSFTVRDLGRAPYLDYILWGQGTLRFDWEQGPLRGNPFAIMKAKSPITNAPRETLEELNEFLEQCLPTDCIEVFWASVP